MNLLQLVVGLTQFAFVFMIPTREQIKKRMGSIDEQLANGFNDGGPGSTRNSSADEAEVELIEQVAINSEKSIKDL